MSYNQFRTCMHCKQTVRIGYVHLCPMAPPLPKHDNVWGTPKPCKEQKHCHHDPICKPVQGVRPVAKVTLDPADTTGKHTGTRPKAALTVENSGAHGSYYSVVVEKPLNPDQVKYIAECNDIIEALDMNFAEGNGFKALWRKAAARQGNGKKDNSALYDAEKVLWSGKRLVAQETK